MATSRILIDGVGIDLTEDTVTPNALLLGRTAHNHNGEIITGTYVPPLGYPIEVSTAANMNALLVQENVGKIYKYTGVTTEVYTHNGLYEVVTDE